MVAMQRVPVPETEGRLEAAVKPPATRVTREVPVGADSLVPVEIRLGTSCTAQSAWGEVLLQVVLPVAPAGQADRLEIAVTEVLVAVAQEAMMVAAAAVIPAVAAAATTAQAGEDLTMAERIRSTNPGTTTTREK